MRGALLQNEAALFLAIKGIIFRVTMAFL